MKRRLFSKEVGFTLMTGRDIYTNVGCHTNHKRGGLTPVGEEGARDAEGCGLVRRLGAPGAVAAPYLGGPGRMGEKGEGGMGTPRQQMK